MIEKKKEKEKGKTTKKQTKLQSQQETMNGGPMKNKEKY